MAKFKVGSKVAYPQQGVGKIVEVVKKKILGKKNEYFLIKLNNKGMTMMIPVDKIKDSALRPVLRKKDISKVKKILQSDKFEIPDDWRERYSKNSEKVKIGSIEGLAEVTRDLYRRNKKKELSIMERKLFESAYTLLTNEIALSKGIDLEEAEDEISNVLDVIYENSLKKDRAIEKRKEKKLAKQVYDDDDYEYDEEFIDEIEKDLKGDNW